jgi:hypothetical protein
METARERGGKIARHTGSVKEERGREGPEGERGEQRGKEA